MTKKEKKNVKKQLRIELIGLLFIFIAIFGSGAAAISDGAIPNALENVFRFFLGSWYFLASIALLIAGIFVIVKRRFPNFASKTMIGIYIGIVGILLFTHIKTLESTLSTGNHSIIKLTWQNFINYTRQAGPGSQTGGGIIGGVLYAFTNYLFSSVGAKIIAIFSIVIGFIFITNRSLGDLFSNAGVKIKSFGKKMQAKWKAYRLDKAATKEAAPKQQPRQLDKSEESEDETFPEVAYAINPNQAPENAASADVPAEQASEETVEEAPALQTAASTETENVDYQLPPIDLLAEPTHNAQHHDKSHIQSTVKKLEKTFHSFGVKAKVTKVHVGPAVTKYEVYPEAGVKVSRIVSLHDDLALALAAQDIRIEAPIPGKSAIGIEVPNQEVAMVSLREVIDVKADPSAKLLFALGRDISGDAVVGELNKMPHLLIAGATGSGKSVCINGIIISILMRAKPNEVKMMMIDPKKVELNIYNGIPHLLTPVVTDPKKASQALRKVVAEMERRYELFSESGTRNIEAYNDYLKEENKTSEETTPNLPYIVVLVDELADLMMVASTDVEDSITRLAQMARAAGIHLIIATQRPSVDVITGVIKANIPSRIAFSVSSQVDSRTILDMGGAEKLLGRGDMLYIPVGQSKPVRVQGAFLSDDEVERIVEHCMNQQTVSYQENMIPQKESERATEVDDEIYDDAVKLVTEMDTASVSMLQRRFRIGYNRAARLIDAMEERGIVGPHEGSRPRTVLVEESSEEPLEQEETEENS